MVFRQKLSTHVQLYFKFWSIKTRKSLVLTKTMVNYFNLWKIKIKELATCEVNKEA